MTAHRYAGGIRRSWTYGRATNAIDIIHVNVGETKFFVKGNNSCKCMSKATNVKLGLYYVKTNFIYQISSQYHKRWERKVRKTDIFQSAITQVKVGQT